MHEFLSKALEDKSIVWFKASNSYIILEEIAAQLVHQILENKTPQKIASVLAEKLTISEQEATHIVKDLNDRLVIPNTIKKVKSLALRENMRFLQALPSKNTTSSIGKYLKLNLQMNFNFLYFIQNLRI